MKKWIVLLILLIASFANATDWYAQNSSVNINSAAEWKTDPTGIAGTTLTWGDQVAGDNFYANAKTAIAVNADPGPNGTVTLRTDLGGAVGAVVGGGFTYATAENLTIHANFIAGTTVCLTITGSTGGGVIYGNANGGAANGIAVNYNTVTVTQHGDAFAGTAANINGVSCSHATGSFILDGTAYGLSNTSGFGVYLNSAGNVSILNCHGSDTTTSVGCHATVSATNGLVVTGNIINGAVGAGANGKIRWQPASAQNYIKFDAGGTPIYASAGLGSDAGGTQVTGANTAAQVKAGSYFVKKDDGIYTQGSASATGGGGSWSF